MGAGVQRGHARYLDPIIKYPKNKTKELVLHSHLSLRNPLSVLMLLPLLLLLSCSRCTLIYCTGRT
jgi:hypothetical protein